MTLQQFEESRALGEPVELFLFRYGSDPAAYYAYCDAEFRITHAGITYEPLAIRRAAIHAAQSLDKQELRVDMPVSSAVAELFKVYPPGNVVTLTIFAGHRNDPDQEFVSIFMGRVQQVSRVLREAQVTVVPASVSLRRTGLRRHYQLTCPHVLYDPLTCRANKALSTSAGRIVSAVGYTSVTLAAGWNGSFLADNFLNGMIEWVSAAGPEKRTIIGVAGNTLSLNSPVGDLSVGGAVDVVLGCKRTFAECETLFNNLVNFGGQRYIPLENPVNTNPFT